MLTPVTDGSLICMVDVSDLDLSALYYATATNSQLITMANDLYPRFYVGIKDVKSYNDKCVKVFFEDGTYEKAVLADGDKFSLETGITICIMKKFFGGTKGYNGVIKQALKIKKKNEEAEAKKKEAEVVAKRQKEKEKRRQAARKERRMREQQKMMEEAYRNAMRNGDLEDNGK